MSSGLKLRRRLALRAAKKIAAASSKTRPTASSIIVRLLRCLPEADPLDPGELFRVPTEDFALTRDQLVDRLELCQTEGRLQRTYLVFERNLVIDEHSVTGLTAIIAQAQH